jgi:cysteine desulfuration protein SufE
VERRGARRYVGNVEMPDKLAAIVDEFASAPRDVVLEMLLEYADAVRPLPAEFEGHAGMEQVPECQTPFFLKADLTPQGTVELFFDCPPEAPTTRAFAGILAEGLEGTSADAVLAVPADLYQRMGLATAISPLRVRGGTAILARLKRQVSEAQALEGQRPVSEGQAGHDGHAGQ